MSVLLFSGNRARQSLEVHLSSLPQLQEVPRARRVDLDALADAARDSLSLGTVGARLAALASPADVRSWRAALAQPELHQLSVMLSVGVNLPAPGLVARVQEVGSLSDWRRTALGWLTTALGCELVERHIARDMFPYLLQHLGYRPDAVPAERLMQRADALAVGRVHHATASLTDQQLHALIRAVQASGVPMGYGLAARAFEQEAPAFLTAFHEGLAARAASSAAPRSSGR